MKNVIIATDFSSLSRATAESVARSLESAGDPCSILLLNTYLVSPATPSENVLHENDRLRKASQELLEEERKRLLSVINNPHVTARTSSRMGTLLNVVACLLKEESLDLVAFGENEGENFQEVSALLRRIKGPRLFKPEVELSLDIS